jgi:D-alanyl-D-alanine carboxypeptidase
VERRAIGIDEPLAAVAIRHLRDGGRLMRLARAYGSRLAGVTVRRLLNMTSGLADYDDAPAFGRAVERDPKTARPLASLASYGLARPRLFRPGAPGRTYYSNTNYALLGMVVEAVTGRSYATELHALFRRAAMAHSSYPAGLLAGVVRGYQPPFPRGARLPDILLPFLRASTVSATVTPRAVLAVSSNPLASGPTVAVTPAGAREQARYGARGTVVWQDVTRTFRLQGVAAAAGGAVSTTGDLARFWRALFAGRLLSSRTVAQMRQSVPAPPSPRGVRNYFALGLQRQDVSPGAFWPGSPPLRIWMKLGDIFGYTSASYYVEGPRPFNGVVVTNTTNLFPSPVGDLGVLRNTLRALM